MTEFEERTFGKYSTKCNRDEMSSMIGNRRGVKPHVEIYRPGSGPLRKSAYGDDDLYQDMYSHRNERGSQERERRDGYNRNFDALKLSDDFDRLSVCSNSSRRDGRHESRSLSGSTGNLSDIRRRSKKPEVPIYTPPKPSTPVMSNQENKRYKSRNYNNSHRNGTKREDSLKGEGEIPLRNVDSNKKSSELANNSQWSDTRSQRGDSEPPSRRPNEKSRRAKKSKRRYGKRENKDENLNRVNDQSEGKITPLMDIKFDFNPLANLKKANSSYDFGGYETSGYTTTDGESERDPPPSFGRNMRQASEPRSLPQFDNRSRDTRSVEPGGEDYSWSQERFNSNGNQKPPLGLYGRRNSKVSHSKHKQFPNSFDSLPPRLKLKYMKENGIQEQATHGTYNSTNTENTYLGSNPDLSHGGTDSEPSYSGPTTSGHSFSAANSKTNYINANTTFIGTNSEDPWDGSSVTFQGTTPTSFYSNVIPPPIFSHPPPPMGCPPPPLWSQTLPPQTRGRGRVPQHELERDRIAFEEYRMTRSLTLDALKETDRNEDSCSFEPLEFLETNENKHSENAFTNDKLGDVPKSPNPSEKMSPSQNEQRSINDPPSVTKNSPVPPKSQDPISKKTPGTGMNWADEVELSEKLQETLEERESEDYTYSFSANPPAVTSPPPAKVQPQPAAGPAATTHRDRDKRRRRKRSISRERFNANDRRRSSVDGSVSTTSRSRKNSGDDRQERSDRLVTSRSRKNSGDDRNWPRSRKNSTDDWNWRREENKDPVAFRSSRLTDHKYGSRNNSRNNSCNNSRNNSMERWTQEDYQHFNGEWKFRGSSGERFRRDNVKGFTPRRRGSRDHSGDRMNDKPKVEENWREEPRRLNDLNSNTDMKKSQKPAGILVLPQSPPKEMELVNKSMRNPPASHTQRQLFDPSNPNRPLIVNTSSDSNRMAAYPPSTYNVGQQMISPDGHFVIPMAPPVHMLHNPNLLKEVEHIDYELNRILTSNSWYEYSEDISKRRKRLQQILWQLLTTDLKFCQQENMEQYFWKILYYNLLELFRKQMAAATQNKESFLAPLLNIIDEGMRFFDETLRVLQECYKFSLEEQLILGLRATKVKQPHLSMALTSAQKILLFLGDLARYREQVQETSNYGLARQWYMKANQLNPKNGRPFYQLAVLAVCARRKLDAVYYYMRSLIAATPVTSSKESLLTLFDENRKKFEVCEKHRQEEREKRDKEKMKEKEFDSKKGPQLRREIWIHPEGRPRVHRTTSAAQESQDESEAELKALPHLDLNKRFSMSFLHVQGKLFTKIGMESFQGAALQMLREFRALLQHTPLPINSTRLLQLLALNMFAIEYTQLKNSELGPGYRSVLQESALVTSLQMFSIILERTVQLLREQISNSYRLIVSDDVQILLPAIKVWCDWLLCHSAIWNPPPSCQDYRVGPAGDVWGRLAALVNLMEKLDSQQNLISEECLEGYEQVRLAEDGTLAGFMPLMCNCPEPMYTSKENNMEVAQVSLRIHKILFCGTVFLCGVDPPVIKLHKDKTGTSEYISVVEIPSPLAQSDSELCVESLSGGESGGSGQVSEDELEGSPGAVVGGGGEIQSLLQRKQQLERSHRIQEKRRRKVQSILQSSLVSVEMEVRPHYVVADTNCFIDYLPQLQAISRATSPNGPHCHLYNLMVPLVVLNELYGLAQGRRDSNAQPEHLVMVTECAAAALEYLRSSATTAIRCVTTRGAILKSATFTYEEDCQDMKNDDKILTTCLNLCHSSKEEHVEGQPRKISRDIVLLTEDRNLRVKALARDVPVREVLDFMKWAGLEQG